MILRNSRFRHTISGTQFAAHHRRSVHISQSLLAAAERRRLYAPQLEGDQVSLMVRITSWNHKPTKMSSARSGCASLSPGAQESENGSARQLPVASVGLGRVRRRIPVGCAARSYVPLPAVSFIGGFRTPAPVCAAPFAMGRHPKPFTKNETAHAVERCAQGLLARSQPEAPDCSFVRLNDCGRLPPLGQRVYMSTHDLEELPLQAHYFRHAVRGTPPSLRAHQPIASRRC